MSGRVVTGVKAGKWEWAPLGDEMRWSSSLFDVCRAGNRDGSPTLEDWLRCVPRADRGAVLAAMASALMRKGTFEVAHRVWREAGTARLATTRGLVLPTPAGDGDVLVGTTVLGDGEPFALVEDEGADDAARDRAVADLRDVALHADGMLRLDRRPVDLAALAAGVLSSARDRARAAGLRFVAEAAGDPVWVVGDEARLRRVAEALVANALRYTDRGGWVSLSVEERGDRARLSVRDNGVGMTTEALEAAFELPRHSASEGEMARAGIALAVARLLVGLHGGEIRAFSPGPNQGVTVTVELPRDA
jgi:anti-sigma regulatory factor (Ser/Thr protein kinase)